MIEKEVESGQSEVKRRLIRIFEINKIDDKTSNWRDACYIPFFSRSNSNGNTAFIWNDGNASGTRLFSKKKKKITKRFRINVYWNGREERTSRMVRNEWRDGRRRPLSNLITAVGKCAGNLVEAARNSVSHTYFS